MAKKGGRTSFQTNVDAAKRLLLSLINLLETEFEKLGNSKTMTRSLHEQLSEEIEEATQRLGELMAPIREQGLPTDESYNSIFAHAGDLIRQFSTDYEIIGGKRRRKTRRRTKVVRKK